MYSIKRTTILFLLWLIVLGTLILQKEQAALHLWLIQWHNSIADQFFKYWTELGSGIPFFIIIGLLFYRYSVALYLLAGQILGGLTSVILKNLFEAPRPKLFFAEQFPHISLPTIEGVTQYLNHSFPSGHTISIVALTVCLSVVVSNKRWQYPLFVVAISVAYSRVYLSLHFAEDIFAGTIIGFLTAVVLIPFYHHLNSKWQQKSLLSTLQKEKKY